MRVELLRREPHADALGGAVGAARGQCAGGTGGQPVLLPRGVREQRAARREGAHHHRGPRRPDPHPDAGARAPEAPLTWRVSLFTGPRSGPSGSTTTGTCALPITP